MIEIHLTKKDFKIDWFSGTGAGGQKRNKCQNCCRITHIATGTQAIATDKERTTNLRNAFAELTKRLLAKFEADEAQNKNPISKEVIRNYNESRNEVHDKASGLKMPWSEIVGKNNIGPMVEARKYSEKI